MDDANAHRRPNLEIARREEPRLDVGLEFPQDAFDESDDPGGDSTSDQREQAWAGCPHVDRNDTRCGHRFSLGRIEQAFNVCFGSFHACPHFHRINNEVAIDVGPVCATDRPHTLVEIQVLARSGVARPTVAVA